MQILGLLGMYFDAVVVEVTTFLLLFRLALVILCHIWKNWSVFLHFGDFSTDSECHATKFFLNFWPIKLGIFLLNIWFSKIKSHNLGPSFDRTLAKFWPNFWPNFARITELNSIGQKFGYNSGKIRSKIWSKFGQSSAQDCDFLFLKIRCLRSRKAYYS